MTSPLPSPFRVAIACGGTGGHLFPGLAVGGQLVRRGCAVTLLISPKDVDQQAVKLVSDMEIFTLPAIGLTRGRMFSFIRGFGRSCFAARRHFQQHPPQAVLAMGGFTSAPPIVAAKFVGARTFLHESNTIPGRANRWLARLVNQAFVAFPSAAPRLRHRRVAVTGTPVRRQFQPADARACRAALGLQPDRPVVLVMGGSQGASGMNELVLKSLPLLAQRAPDWQWFHLTGPNDEARVRHACEALKLTAVVHPFFAGMELALGAATVAISRAGGSSLAEIAAMRVPAVLVPLPTATDNHQFHNARAFQQSGAAYLLEQNTATAEALAGLLLNLVADQPARDAMQAALARWHAPQAAEQIADAILQELSSKGMDIPVAKSPVQLDSSDRMTMCQAPLRLWKATAQARTGARTFLSVGCGEPAEAGKNVRAPIGRPEPLPWKTV